MLFIFELSVYWVIGLGVLLGLVWIKFFFLVCFGYDNRFWFVLDVEAMCFLGCFYRVVDGVLGEGSYR